MEFNEKLQELRKRKGLTQEELAEKLFVSRTAISKWESGRGYPNIESLKAISKFFSVTIDDLLSGEEALTIAEEDNRQKETRFKDLVLGLLDCSVVMFLFLPFFGQSAGDAAMGVSLPVLVGIGSYLKGAYLAVVASIVIMGVVTLVLRNCGSAFWVRHKNLLSMLPVTIGTLLFIVSRQPYAAVYLFILLVIKALILVKRR